MMNDALCTYDGRRDEVLVAYLYEDIDAAERKAFEAHLAGCLPCRTELDALTDVREGLTAWAAPETAEGIGGRAPRAALRIVKSDPEPAPQHGHTSIWRLADAPVWMQAAAAMLVVAASLGLANINLTYSRDALTLTTGWRKSTPAAVNDVDRPAGTTIATLASENADLRKTLAALREQVDTIRAQTVGAPAAKPDDASLAREVKAQLQESERRQQREFDLRFAEMARDFQVQRQSDLARFDRVLGVYQSRTGMQVMQQQQQLNDLLRQRVSEQR